MIKLSVCIPVWNQQELVLRALDHIPRRDDIEVLVRDDEEMAALSEKRAAAGAAGGRRARAKRIAADDPERPKAN